mmetsp:Transcript_25582/g.64165  ORF Transcript_25582/g.64165 Transcript_25582/m.64165 type:complete len:105 (+) Transcript_25582:80-394(+)
MFEIFCWLPIWFLISIPFHQVLQISIHSSSAQQCFDYVFLVLFDYFFYDINILMIKRNIFAHPSQVLNIHHGVMTPSARKLDLATLLVSRTPSRKAIPWSLLTV